MSEGNLDEIVRAEMEAFTRFLDEKLATAMVRKRLLEKLQRDLAAIPGPLAPSQDVPVTGQVPAPSVDTDAETVVRLLLARAGAADSVILKALATAPAEGLPGRELNALMLADGLTIDTAEKSKTRLRHRGILAHDTTTGLWSLTPWFRSTFPNHVSLLPTRIRKGRPRGQGTAALDIVLRTIDCLGEEATSPRVYEAGKALELSYSTVKHALHEIRVTGAAVRADGIWRRKADMPSAD